MEKYHKTDICPVEKENERDETYKATNPQIDSSRTNNNYHILNRHCSYTEFINNRIKELNLPTKPRKDAVLMTSFVIGSDGTFFKGLMQEQQRSFFTECTKFFADRYGNENIISAVVHMDETTPHLHLNLVPIRNNRLCCKDLFNRTELSRLQTDFHEAVGKQWNLNRGRENTHIKHLSTAEYKASKIIQNAVSHATDISNEAETKLQHITEAVTKAESHFDDTVKQIHSLNYEQVKTFLYYFANKHYTDNEAKNEFFNSFIYRVVLFDDKVYVFYNTSPQTPTKVKLDKDELDELRDNTKNTQFEPLRFELGALGGERGIRTPG